MAGDDRVKQRLIGTFRWIDAPVETRILDHVEQQICLETSAAIRNCLYLALQREVQQPIDSAWDSVCDLIQDRHMLHVGPENPDDQ